MKPNGNLKISQEEAAQSIRWLTAGPVASFYAPLGYHCPSDAETADWECKTNQAGMKGFREIPADVNNAMAVALDASQSEPLNNNSP